MPIEDKAPEIEYILNRPPKGIVLWASSFMATIISVVVISCYFIKYPEVVSAVVYITTEQPPINLYPKSDGKILKLFVENNQIVEKGKILIMMQSTADLNEINDLENDLKLMKKNINDKNNLKTTFSKNYENLGEMQKPFQDFSESLIQLKSFQNKSYYRIKQLLFNKDLETLVLLKGKTKEQLILMQQDLNLAKEDYDVQYKLFSQKVIPKLEYRKAQSAFIAKELPVKEIQENLINLETQINSKKNSKLELEKQYFEYNENYVQAFSTLLSALEQWKSTYIIASPRSGIVNFHSKIQVGQKLLSNVSAFQIISNNFEYKGILNLKQENVGNVKVGQTVIIKLAGYPYQEFGVIVGRVSDISPTVNEKNYLVANVDIRSPLITTAKKRLLFKNNMNGTADIITQDVNLLKRIFMTYFY